MMDPKDVFTRPRDEVRSVPVVKRRGERLIGLLIAGLVLLNFPFLSVFSVNSQVFGVPVLYFYLFSVWTLTIGAIALVLRDPPANPAADKREDEER